MIDRLLERAQQGESGCLVLRGEPGIGKTSLLDYAASSAGETMVVLRATGVEAEADLAFGGLFGLLRPILERLDRLVATQAQALQGAFGLLASPSTDRFLVSAAVLSLLAAAAEDEPVLCLVDDAHWLDLPSSGALAFAARRLFADRVAIVFAAREHEGRFESQGLPELSLSGLDEQSSARLLASGDRRPAPKVCARLLAEAAGNPLALRELPAALSDDQLSGREPLPKAIPLTPRLHGVFRAQIEDLPDDTRDALLVCAAETTGDAETILRALDRLGWAATALGPAERSGLVEVRHGKMVLRHPLVRSAIYHLATMSERQRVHAALAQVLNGDEHADRRAWHQAMAAVERDEEVAAALEGSARRAESRGGHASAAVAFERAAELSPEQSSRTERWALAARAAWLAGQSERAGELIARALPAADGTLRAQLLRLRGAIESRCGNKRDALETVREGIAVSADHSLTLEMLLDGLEAAALSGDRARVSEFAALAARLRTTSVWDEFRQVAVIAFAAMLAGEFERAQAHFDEVVRLAVVLEDPKSYIWAARAASFGLGLGAGQPFAARAVRLAREQGLLSLLPTALDQHAAELFRNSAFDLAYAAAEEGYALSVELGQGWGWHTLTMARVEAIRGRETDARAHLEQLLAFAQRGEEVVLAAATSATVGLMELSLGRAEDAASSLLRLTATGADDVSGKHRAHPIAILHPIPDAIEAAIRAGRPKAQVEVLLARYRGWVLQAPMEARRSFLARCEALTGDRHPDEAFQEALDLAHPLSQFERARTQLLYGEWLRRERRRTDARDHLRPAVEIFHALGAAPWESRAEAELRATGETARRREPSARDQLTPQELKIAELASDGMTNPEIAAQLFLSPRTIEYHLGKVFDKLGIASRTELVRDRASVASLALPV